MHLLASVVPYYVYIVISCTETMHVCAYVGVCKCILYMTLVSMLQCRLEVFLLISWLLRKCMNRKEFVNLSFLFPLFVWHVNDKSFN
jgi:hypothetical protein